jgi:Mor family transcriptional regulator
MEDWTKEIKIDDLDEKNREIAELIGIDNFLKLIEFYGGTRIYFNKLDEVTKTIRDRKIKREYNRYNIGALAKKYNLAYESVRRILKDEPIENQISIIDF